MCLAQRKQAKLLFVHPFDLNDRLKSFLSQNAVPLHEIDHRSAALEKTFLKPISQLITLTGSFLPHSSFTLVLLLIWVFLAVNLTSQALEHGQRGRRQA